jgi:hypothetical protein
MIPSDFLHYGYFDDPLRRPEDISLGEVTRAQARYSELLLDLAGDPSLPVLDVDDELTLAVPVVPGLVDCHNRQRPTGRPRGLSSLRAGDFQISGRHVGLELVVVDSEPRHCEVHG